MTPSGDSTAPSRRRRRFLRQAGVALSVALSAGCLSNPWEPGGTGQATDDAADGTGGSGGRSTTTAAASGGGGTRDSETTDSETTGEERGTTTGTATATRTATAVPPENLDPDQVVEVAPDGFQYAPETFEIAVGDTVHWVWRDGGHNVRVDAKPDGSDWTGTPGTDSDTFSEGFLHAHTFTVAGHYECYCAPHQSLGLRGSFDVR